MICGHCGMKFEPKTHNQKYCSLKCRLRAKEMRAWHRDTGWAHTKRERNHTIMLKSRERWKLEGKCSRCGRENDNSWDGLKVCSTCREYLRNNK